MMRKKILHSFNHFLIGAVLTIKGIDKITSYPLISGIMLLGGILVLSYFIYEITGKPTNKLMKSGIYLVEGIAVLLTAWIYWNEGKTYLPWILVFAAFGFIIAAVLIIRGKNLQSVKH